MLAFARVAREWSIGITVVFLAIIDGPICCNAARATKRCVFDVDIVKPTAPSSMRKH